MRVEPLNTGIFFYATQELYHFHQISGKSQLARESALLSGVQSTSTQSDSNTSGLSSNTAYFSSWKTSSCTYLDDIPYQSLQGAISLLVPRKTAVTSLNLHQCDNNVLGCLSCFPCLQQTKVKNACSDGVCQTSRSFEIYYSKTIQQDVRECAVTWLQLFSLIQKHTQDVTTI